MVLETRRMVDVMQMTAETAQQAAAVTAVESQKMTKAAQQTAEAAVRKADAAWELVIMTRNQIQEDLRYMRLPWWKKLISRIAFAFRGWL